MRSGEILTAALEQSAVDSNCSAADFNSVTNKVVISKPNDGARKYLELPFLCDLTSYGSNIVASVSAEVFDIVSEYIGKYPIEQCFAPPALDELMAALKPFGANRCYMSEYFLPVVDSFPVLSCKYETRLLAPTDFESLYLPEWSNALCKNRRQLDMLAVGAYDNGKLIALAGCSADCDAMWQIGIDVLPEYRRQGIASAITNLLARETMNRGKIPFYCCAWANIKSAKNALRSGFSPAWVQLTINKE